MGQRHQAYLIARIASPQDNQARYRCVAAVDHQWCYGHGPPEAALRIITLAKQDTNARVIREELRRLSTINIREEEKPSHYLSSLLCFAFHFVLENNNPYVDGKMDWYFHPANLPITQTENNDGITIVDVTDPANCTYVHMPGDNTPGFEEGFGEFLDANAYICAYFPERNSYPFRQEENVKAVMASMKEVPVLSSQAVREAWPDEFDWIIDDDDDDPIQCTQSPEVTHTPSIPSLSDLVLLPALKQAIETDDFYGIEQILSHPEKAGSLFSMFRDLPDFHPMTDRTLPFLAKVPETIRIDSGKDMDILDLSHFHLSSEQICLLLEENPNIETLDLSYNPLVTISAVEAVLKTETRFRKLILLSTSISSRDWTSILHDSPHLFKYLETIIHPSFIQSDVPFNPQFLFVPMNGYDGSVAAMPFFTPTQVVQALVTFFQIFVHQRRPDFLWILYRVARSDAPAVVISAETLRPGSGWAERDVPFIATKPNSPIGTSTWAFVLSTTNGSCGFMKLKREYFAFTDVGPDNLTWEIHDLASFLQEMNNEGRAKPDLEMAQALENLLTSIETQWRQGEGYTKLKPLSETDAEMAVGFLDQLHVVGP